MCNRAQRRALSHTKYCTKRDSFLCPLCTHTTFLPFWFCITNLLNLSKQLEHWNFHHETQRTEKNCIKCLQNKYQEPGTGCTFLRSVGTYKEASIQHFFQTNDTGKHKFSCTKYNKSKNAFIFRISQHTHTNFSHCNTAEPQTYNTY
jgi:hypothetical protein